MIYVYYGAREDGVEDAKALLADYFDVSNIKVINQDDKILVRGSHSKFSDPESREAQRFSRDAKLCALAVDPTSKRVWFESVSTLRRN